MEKPATLQREQAPSRQPLRCLAFSADGRQLAVAGDDLVVRLFDTRDWTQTAELVGHSAAVNALRFAPAAPLLASVSADHTLRLWTDFASASEQHCLTVQAHADAVTDLCFARPQRVVTCGADGRLYSQGCAVGQNPRLLRKETEGFSCLQLFAAGDLLLAGTARGALLAVEAQGGKTVFALGLRAGQAVRALCVAEGSGEAFAAYADSTLQVIDLMGRAVKREFTHHARITSMQVSADCQTLFVADAEGGIAFCSPPGATDALLLKAHAEAVTAICLHGPSDRLAAVDAAGRLAVWELPRAAAFPPLPALPPPPPVAPAPPALASLRVEKIRSSLGQLASQLDLMAAMLVQTAAQLDFLQDRLGRSYK